MIAWILTKLSVIVFHALEPWDGYIPPFWSWWPA